MINPKDLVAERADPDVDDLDAAAIEAVILEEARQSLEKVERLKQRLLQAKNKKAAP